MRRDPSKETEKGRDDKEHVAMGMNYCKAQKTASYQTPVYPKSASQEPPIIDKDSKENTFRAPSPNTLSGEVEDSPQESGDLALNPFPEGAQVPHCVVAMASKYWGDEGLLRPKSATPSDRCLSIREMPTDDFKGGNAGFQNM